MPKRLLLLAIGIATGSLFLLTYLQYRSLTDLQIKTKAAYSEGLRQQSIALEREVTTWLKAVSEPLSAASQIDLSGIDRDSQVRQFLSSIKASRSEIDQAFLFVDCGCDSRTGPAYLDSEQFRQIPHSEIHRTAETREIAHAYENARIGKSYLSNDGRFLVARHKCITCADDAKKAPKILIILPLTKADGPMHGGFAGLSLRESQLNSQMFPAALRNIRGADLADPKIALSVTDDSGALAFASSENEQRYVMEHRFSPPLAHWTVNSGYEGTDIELLANQSYWQGVILTGIVLLLFGASGLFVLSVIRREMQFAETKSAFVANISHELRTPIATIRLFVEMMGSGKVRGDEKIAQYYKVISTESFRLSRLVDRVLDFAHMEAGQKVYHLKSADIGELVAELVETCNLRCQMESFQLACRVERPLRLTLIDSDSLTQAVLNLIDNAIKYSGPNKQVNIVVQSNSDFVEIVVADNGCGIPRSEFARVFDRFYRIGSGLVHDVKGSGLGLSIVKHIVDGHHGNIRIESTLGIGSKFTISIPIRLTVSIAPRGTIGESYQVAKSANS